jgi:hypothetical protein
MLGSAEPQRTTSADVPSTPKSTSQRERHEPEAIE